MPAPVTTSSVTAVTINGFALSPVKSVNAIRSPTSTPSEIKLPSARVNVLPAGATVIDRSVKDTPDCHVEPNAPASQSSWLFELSSIAYSPLTCLLPVRMDVVSRLPSSSLEVSVSRVMAGTPPVLRNGDQTGLVGVTPGVTSAT